MVGSLGLSLKALTGVHYYSLTTQKLYVVRNTLCACAIHVRTLHDQALLLLRSKVSFQPFSYTHTQPAPSRA